MRKASVWPIRVCLIALSLALITASLALWRVLEDAQQQRMQERVGYQARLMARQLEDTLKMEISSLARIGRLWDQLSRLSEDDWAVEANLALERFPAYQSIQWLGPDLRMRWLLPHQGNEAAQSFQLMPSHPNYAIAMQAKHSGEQRFSNSVGLVQGGRGFILYTPLFLRNADETRRFDGFLQGVFRVDQLMDQLLRSLDSNEFSVQLLENGLPIYRHEQAGSLPQLTQSVPLLLLDNRSFSLQLSPTPTLLQRLKSPLPEVVLGAALIISLLLVAALVQTVLNKRRANELQRANRHLQVEARRRAQIEKRLNTSREHLQLVLDLTDSSHDSLFIFATEGRELLHMNQVTYASLGYRPEQFAQLLREQPEQLIPGYAGWLEQVRKAQLEGQSRIFQREMRRRDGSRQPAEINTQLVLLGGREYLIAVSRDNSERLELEARLQRLSQQDGLTGLYNRRFFDQRLQSEWRRLRRSNSPMALLMIDIDYFKAYNDALGHLAGDDALRKVASALQDCVQREGDVACRYGGEEFVLIMVDTDVQGSEHLAEQIHQQIERLNIEHPGSPLKRLTLSIGIAVADPVEDEQGDQLVAHSDQALYQAKERGRNRTQVWAKAENIAGG